VTDLVFVDSDLYSCSEDRSWQSWDRRQNMRPATKVTASSALNALVALPTRQHLVSGDEKGQIEL
jgi:hypothetical protein